MFPTKVLFAVVCSNGSIRGSVQRRQRRGRSRTLGPVLRGSLANPHPRSTRRGAVSISRRHCSLLTTAAAPPPDTGRHSTAWAAGTTSQCPVPAAHAIGNPSMGRHAGRILSCHFEAPRKTDIISCICTTIIAISSPTPHSPCLFSISTT